MANNTKQCAKCKKWKLFSKFGSNINRKGGLHYYCKKCANIKNAKWRRDNSELSATVQRKVRLKIRFDITIEQYDKMFEQQNGLCAICGEPETAENQYGVIRLAIDHDHKTGKIRALLCRGCNQLLGCAKENTITLQSAINYLHSYSSLKNK